MAMKLSRNFLNPVLVLSGGLTLVSGLYLFFHLKSRPIVLIHEWSSIIFVVACAAHLALNWNLLLKSLGSRAVAWTLLAVALLSGLGMAFTGIKTDHRHRQRIVDDGRSAAEARTPPLNSAVSGTANTTFHLTAERSVVIARGLFCMSRDLK